MLSKEILCFAPCLCNCAFERIDNLIFYKVSSGSDKLLNESWLLIITIEEVAYRILNSAEGLFQLRAKWFNNLLYWRYSNINFFNWNKLFMVNRSNNCIN